MKKLLLLIVVLGFVVQSSAQDLINESRMSLLSESFKKTSNISRHCLYTGCY